MRKSFVILVFVAGANAAGLTDDAMGATSILRLDGDSARWSAELRPVVSPQTKCSFQQGKDLRGSGDGRKLKAVSSAGACCDACLADATCVGATYCEPGSDCDKECWIKTAAQAAGGTYDRKGRVACMKSTAPTPAPAPQPPLITIPAHVPGDIITDMELAGAIGDPLYELNFKNSSLWATARARWVYTTTFSSANVFGSGTGADAVLVFDGVKMGATVKLNGVVLGTVTDQFLRYNFSVSELLRGTGGGSAGANNTLEVEFDGTDTNGRYMACTGGWDWGPYSNTYAGADHTFSYGLWKGVYIASTAAQSATIVHASPSCFTAVPTLCSPCPMARTPASTCASLCL